MTDLKKYDIRPDHRDRQRRFNPNDVFVENPSKQLPPPGAVQMEIPYHPGFGADGLCASSNKDIAFYLRLKATKGCTSKQHPNGNSMHIYIEPNSEAVVLFVQWLTKNRRLQEADAMRGKLLTEGGRFLKEWPIR